MFFENFIEESKSIQSMKMGDYQAHLGLIKTVFLVLKL
jgi:hypothetical protein